MDLAKIEKTSKQKIYRIQSFCLSSSRHNSKKIYARELNGGSSKFMALVSGQLSVVGLKMNSIAVSGSVLRTCRRHH